MLPEEWYENFKMSRQTFLALCDKLRPHFTHQETPIKSLLSIETQVSTTLYYLVDEGHIRKTANAFGRGQFNNFCHHLVCLLSN